MVLRPLSIAIATGLATGLAFAQTGNPIVDNSRISAPSPVRADTPETKPEITPELRGDIFMAEKHYREAIEAFRQGSPKDPVLWNKSGIAYHQMLQLGDALKSYQQAVTPQQELSWKRSTISARFTTRARAIGAPSRITSGPSNWSPRARIGRDLQQPRHGLFRASNTRRRCEAFQTALSLDPEVYEHRGSYGVMLEERNVEERAKYHLLCGQVVCQEGRNGAGPAVPAEGPGRRSQGEEAIGKRPRVRVSAGPTGV